MIDNWESWDELKADIRTGLFEVKDVKTAILEVDRWKELEILWRLNTHDFDFWGKLDNYIFNKSYYKISILEGEESLENDIKKLKENCGMLVNIQEKYSTTKKIIGEKDITTEAKKLFKLNKGRELIRSFGFSVEKLAEKDTATSEAIIKYIKRELLTNKQNNFDIYHSHNMDNIETLFNEKFEIDKKTDTAETKIVKVFEKDNLRCAVISNEEIIFAIPKSPVYNYLDEGRFIYFKNYSNNIAIFDKNVNIENYHLLESNMVNENTFYISNETLSNLVSQKRNKAKLEILKKNKEKELDLRIKIELEKNGSFTSNGIKRQKEGYFIYNKQKIGFVGFEVMCIDKDEKDFNSIFDIIIRNFKIGKLWGGSFEIELSEKEPYKFINGIRINKIEIKEVLKRALCFQTKEQYDELLKEVSKCSLKIHDALSSGLIYNFKTNRWDITPIFSKVELERKEKVGFILFNNQKYQIHNINSLIDAQNWQYKSLNSHNLAELLSKTTTLTYDDAINVIKDGLKAYREALKRAEQLLKETIKILGVRKVDIKTEEYSGKGYIVKGNKEYFISKEDLKVYEYPKMRYICVIDKGNVSTLNSTDKLISRLYACKNDNAMAEQKLITTMPIQLNIQQEV